MKRYRTNLYIWGLLFTLTVPFFSQAEESRDLATTQSEKLDDIIVFGTSMGNVDKGFNPKKVSNKVIESFQFTDVNRALKHSSGVYIREEDGQGLRPNIGLRGTNPDRSKKVVILEDDILIGPAPYSAPAAYYVPDMNHIYSLEVWKGFSAIHIGPNSIGGAVNYVTAPIRNEKGGEFKMMGGSFNTLNTKVNYSSPTDFGGYLIQGAYLRSDGFKKVDGGGDAGFDKIDISGKLKWNLPSAQGYEHFLQAHLGYAYEDSNETYLGLSRADLDADPFRRYSSSALDEMLWTHQKYQLTHVLQLSDAAVLKTSAYRHDFNRDWYRADRFRGGQDFRSLLARPSSAPFYYEILTGARDSSDLGQNAEIVIAGNDRTYYSQGIQTQFSSDYTWDQTRISPEFFVRYHQDQIKRNHTSDRYEMLDGRLERTMDPTQIDARESQTSNAFTLSARTSIEFHQWNITPVMRYEWVEMELDDRLNPSRNAKRSDHIFIPGLSALYKWHSKVSTAVSYNKAATLSGISVAGTEVKEEADNFEMQLKYRDAQNFFEADLTGFYTHYQNITGTCTVSSGCTGTPLGVAFNGGKANIMGVEASATKGFAFKSFYLPLQVNMTFLTTEFDSTFNSINHEWGIGAVSKGDPLPYVPKAQYSLTVGAETARTQNYLSVTYQSLMYDQSIDNANRIEIPSYTVVDFAGRFAINEGWDLNYKVDNLLGLEYLVAARPAGFRPGKRQSFHLGVTHKF